LAARWYNAMASDLNIVPIPGTIWLFGPLLIGIIGLRGKYMKS